MDNYIEQDHFIQSHPLHVFTENDCVDYSQRNEYFIQTLRTLENMMDIDAYIIDYMNKRILYATKGCAAYFGKKRHKSKYWDIHHLDHIILPDDRRIMAAVNSLIYSFFYSLPPERRLSCYFTQDFRIKTKKKNSMPVNHRGTILDLTHNGVIRLTLCIISYSTGNKPGNAYIKMTDDNTIYKFMASSQKFVEVKTQKLTSKSTVILQLTSNGKTEPEIAEILGISINTVKYHKKRIFAQIDVRNSAEAIQWMNNQKKMIR